ncbi:hypothetical protein FTX61_15970 [Nitriliruptoraceae bacterium ZYF776]|nr:hypothetical protein [Profundirhabdus halotolerans]
MGRARGARASAPRRSPASPLNRIAVRGRPALRGGSSASWSYPPATVGVLVPAARAAANDRVPGGVV